MKEFTEMKGAVSSISTFIFEAKVVALYWPLERMQVEGTSSVSYRHLNWDPCPCFSTIKAFYFSIFTGFFIKKYTIYYFGLKSVVLNHKSVF